MVRAHKAAHPDKYPIKEESQRLYPAIQEVHMRPTFVHLQVYDGEIFNNIQPLLRLTVMIDMAHVLPLFSFTTPVSIPALPLLPFPSS